jgi:uncharacterized membrane protein YoaK (UPF0700 family)
MGRVSDEWTRDTLVVLLTVTTGVIDAASFLAFGGAFSSVITGNLVLLGISAGMQKAVLASHAGVALAGYSAGVAAGVPLAAHGPGSGGGGTGASGGGTRAGGGGTWPRSVTVALAAEFAVLALFSGWWEAQGGHPGGTAQLAGLAVLAACMGVQAAAVRRLGQMSTTYLTSTLTGVIGGLVTPGKTEALPRSLGVLAAIVAGAVIGAVVVTRGPAWLPAGILIPLAAVVCWSAAVYGRTGERRPARA